MMIAFDIDGVFVDFTKEIYIPTAKAELGLELQIVNGDSYDYTEHLGITKEQEKAIWQSSHMPDFMAQANPIPHALNLLSTANDYFFITSRGTHHGDARDEAVRGATDYWLRYRIQQTSIPLIFAKPEEKAAIIEKWGALVVWDDHPETAFTVADNGTVVFMPLYGYNKHVFHHNVFRVEGWVNGD